MRFFVPRMSRTITQQREKATDLSKLLNSISRAIDSTTAAANQVATAMTGQPERAAKLAKGIKEEDLSFSTRQS